MLFVFVKYCLLFFCIVIILMDFFGFVVWVDIVYLFDVDDKRGCGRCVCKKLLLLKEWEKLLCMCFIVL